MKDTLIVLIVVLLLHLMPWNAEFETSDELIQRRPPDKYEELCDFIAEGEVHDKSRFWIMSKGLRGSFHRVQLSRYDLRIVQARSAERYITKGDAAVIWFLLAGQVIFTLLAVPEAALCRIFGNRHLAALQALKFYCALVLRANTLYTVAKPV